MSSNTARNEGGARSLLVRQALDAGVYANVVALAALGVAVVAGFGLSTYFGCDLVHSLVLAKQVLFFGGFAVMGYGALAMRPRTPRGKGGREGSLIPGVSKQDRSTADASDGPEVDPTESRDEGDAGPVQSVVEAVLAALSIRIARHERITTGWKLVAAGFYVLLVTIAMELVGIHVVNFPCVPA